ncbi:uncharacterized protein LOC110856106 [Folsomia candida]|uniref:uncharacterized protein LOC110856106 n=1 Tax=Folsomia candida TaxID=158441 RepID=UPI000B8F7B94|nr:uncharacterized protein LOC110856106 [Folsomia candida]
MGSHGSRFRLTVEGKISANPFQFAINVKEGSNTLFHMNPRWSEGRTVFNICHSSRGWGQPEYAFFSSLTPKANFRVEIVYQGGRFEVVVNDEPAVYFQEKLAMARTEKEITVEKVDQKDLALRSVQLVEF